MTDEGALEFQPPAVKLGPIGFGGGGKSSLKRAKQRGLEVTAGAYAEGEAQQDLIAILEALTSGFDRRLTWLQRLGRALGRRNQSPRTALKLDAWNVRPFAPPGSLEDGG